LRLSTTSNAGRSDAFLSVSKPSFMEKYAALVRNIGYQFSDIDLLTLVLTHRSRGAKNYERLEFLGDSILGFVVAEWLYKQFPELAEGKLSRMRSSLVRKETLAQVARVLELGDFLILGEGEMKSGGFKRDSILSDTVESMIGGIYLDGGFAQAERFIFEKFAEQFDSVSELSSFKDAKSLLQEEMQKHGMPLPNYLLIETTGAQHEQEFLVECQLVELNYSAQARANTLRLAEQKSAQLVLEQLIQTDSQKYKLAAASKV